MEPENKLSTYKQTYASPLQYYAMVTDFHHKFAVKGYNRLHDLPEEAAKLRVKLIQEEYEELKTAKTAVDELDAICDLMYVVLGTGVTVNSPIPLDPAFDMHRDFAITDLCSNLRSVVPCQTRFGLATKGAMANLWLLGRSKNYDVHSAFFAVHKNNMDKLWTEKPADPTLIVTKVHDRFLVRRPDGKVLKPANHTKVDLSKYV